VGTISLIQTYGENYETSAPVVRKETIRMLFGFAAEFKLRVEHLDVKTAFLYGKLKETVYMCKDKRLLKNLQQKNMLKVNVADNYALSCDGLGEGKVTGSSGDVNVKDVSK
jgi:hypothetical protein